MNQASIIDSILDNSQSINIPQVSDEFVADASAVSDVNKAHQKILSMIERGTNRASHVIEKIMSETPTDEVAASHALRFSGEVGKLTMSAPKMESKVIHHHAMNQIATTAGIPISWANKLEAMADFGKDGNVDPYGAKLLANEMNEIMKRSGTRHLLRSVGGELRGFLSDRYRRLNSHVIMDRLFAAMQAAGLRPYDGFFLDTKVEVQAIIPKIFSPYPGELLAFGLTFRSSDYGDGALDIRGFTIRPACANGMIRESILRQVHLGGRLSNDMELSERTYKLDTETMASATFDIVTGAFDPQKIEREMRAVRDAHEKELDPKKAEARLRKLLSKSESDAAIKLFNSPDVVALPPGQSNYRMSNAISWLANQTKDERRKIELQEVAGEWISAKA